MGFSSPLVGVEENQAETWACSATENASRAQGTSFGSGVRLFLLPVHQRRHPPGPVTPAEGSTKKASGQHSCGQQQLGHCHAVQGSHIGQAFDQTIQCKDTSQVAQLLCFTWTAEAGVGIIWEM